MVLADRRWTLCPSEGTAGEIAPDSIFAFIPAPEHRMTRAVGFSKLRPHQLDPLTTRERQIVRVVAEGLTNKEIARRLRLAEGTVKVHLHRIYGKLGIGNRTALAILAHTNFARHVH
jgi:DNA-binding NarL/FixJ family response regulator